jgi:multidrug transporter EmrE-like cation transporter
MFGVQFFFNDLYRKEEGSTVASAFTFTLFGNIAGLALLLVINGFDFGYAPFTIFMAALATVNSLLYSVCSLKALDNINLSLYSIFAMLGGMLLPFLFGVIFYSEPLTVGNLLCLVITALALVLTLKKGNGSKGYIYYIGVFVLNGMSGVLSKLFHAAPYPKDSAAVYTIWMSILTVVSSAIILLFMRKKYRMPKISSLLYSTGYGVINKIANYFLLIALAVLPASVQYPFVTGGTMIVSTVISIFAGQKPSVREYISVALSFAGILALVFIGQPI